MPVIAVTSAAVAALLLSLLRARTLRPLLSGALGGLLSLAAVGLSGLLGTPLLTANLFTVFVACFLGIPGVISMLLLRLISMI